MYLDLKEASYLREDNVSFKKIQKIIARRHVILIPTNDKSICTQCEVSVTHVTKRKRK